ncbi:FkbM family methyltransferase [Halomonas sp. Mc5H-6]|uniref:FkbM family methyltransferase n=1 Tax=Halomonas sp. Mc5H-6 TaxID=2954500 RepID=UPI00209740C1|nr:FkbM family methyltransferase [Halomonas sp. Mc5H-6]MCO7246812.1 FkbM family methyltransferase [Halomonas sp. Mc5H-6]
MLKNMVKNLLPNWLLTWMRSAKNDFFDGYARKSYSQEGEDLILMRFFENKDDGFYVDVGAHHPKRFSNTYLFYKKGWCGINIDAKPGSMEAFKEKRCRDINIEKPISEKPMTLTYYMFNEPALNGFSKEISESRDGVNGFKVESKIKLNTERLDRILDEYISPGTEIDFLSIDVEGLDFEVIKSLDLARYNPKFILVEILGSSLSELLDSEISQYLLSYGYKLYGKAVNTVFFKK